MAADETELAGTDRSPLKASYVAACGTAEMGFRMWEGAEQTLAEAAPAPAKPSGRPCSKHHLEP